MSPRRTCTRHGAPTPCARCRARTRPPERRAYSDTARYREVLAEVVAEHGPVCVLYCGQPIDEEDLVLAHVIAHADGGAFEPPNLRPAHSECNNRAGRR